MRDEVRSRLERCERASLVYDLEAIATNMRRVAGAARAARITPLFAMKSFPDPRVVALAAELLDGFDAASIGELQTVPTGALVSIVDPSGAAISHAPAGRRVIVGCETIEQVRAAPAHAEIAIRVSASITGRDPAVGAIVEVPATVARGSVSTSARRSPSSCVRRPDGVSDCTFITAP